MGVKYLMINVVVQTLESSVKSATKGWTDSGMVVPRGQGIRLFSSGRLRYGDDGKEYSFPEGTYPPPDNNQSNHIEDLANVDTRTGLSTGKQYPAPELRLYSLAMVLWPDGAGAPPYLTGALPPGAAFQVNREYSAIPVPDSVFTARGSDNLRVWFTLNDKNKSDNSGAWKVRLERIQEMENGSGSDTSGGRTIPSELFSLLQNQSQHPAWCWAIKPLSGEREFYTSLDIPLQLPDYVSANGLNPIPAATYQTGHGVEITAIPTTLKVETDGTDVMTLNFDRLKLLGGYYFGAEVEVFEVDWKNPQAGRWVAFSGHLGNAIVGDIGATIELATWDELLIKRRSNVTSYSCTHKFCAGLCTNIEMGNGPVLSDWARQGTVVSVSTATIFTVEMSAGFLTNGIRETSFYSPTERLNAWKSRLREGVVKCLTDGPNALLRRQTKVATEEISDLFTIELREKFPVPFKVGDVLNISSGCTKTPEMCKLYRNFKNYGGLPFMPLPEGVRRS
jgi:hypothetical protein